MKTDSLALRPIVFRNEIESVFIVFSCNFMDHGQKFVSKKSKIGTVFPLLYNIEVTISSKVHPYLKTNVFYERWHWTTQIR